jgi:hypothetical protein
MVIHIVNGYESEKPSFLQFIRKTEQLCGLALTRKNQIWRRQPRRPVQNATDRVIGDACAEQIGGVLGDSLRHRLKSSPHVDYEGFHARFGDRSSGKIARCRQCRPGLRANFEK